MSARRRDHLPAGLEAVRRRFEQWRETHQRGARISDSLWAAAALAGQRHGVSKTANVLRVNYQALKRRLAARKGASCKLARGRRSEREGGAAFVELPSFASACSGGCLLELEDAGGDKMRIHLQGMGTPDLVELSRSFWDRRP
jgi:hypothetical protein